MMILLYLDFVVLLSQWLQQKVLSDTNLFSPNDYERNEKIIYKYFKDKYGKIKRKFWIKTKKIDKRRNYVLQEMKQWLE